MGGGGTHQIAKSLRLPSTVKKINAKLKSRQKTWQGLFIVMIFDPFLGNSECSATVSKNNG